MFVRERREQEMFEIEPPDSHRLCLSRPPRARTPALREHVGRGPRCAAVRTPGSASCDERRDGELQQLERQQTVPPGARRSGCKARRARLVPRGRRCARQHASAATLLAAVGGERGALPAYGSAGLTSFRRGQKSWNN